METKQLKCRFCNVVTGEIKQTYGIHPISIDDIIDIRCSDCEALHGTFKELETLWRHRVKKKKDTYNDFKKLAKKANYKKVDFIKQNKIKEI